MLAEQQVARYSRQIILPGVGGKGQQRLLSASAAIIGEGQMATTAALYLVAAGLGTIRLGGPHDIDLADLEALNPDCQVAPWPAEVDAVGAENIARGHDFTIVAGAAAEATAALNLACVRLGKPLVWGSAEGDIGRMAVLAGGQPGMPCYRCLQPRSEENCSARDSSQPAGAMFGVVGAFVGALQATMVIKLVLGLEAPTPARLLTYDGLAAAVRQTAIAKDPRCDVCGAPSS
jgi:molybdopterin/thiamine biosynthesis adenylyltransferase